MPSLGRLKTPRPARTPPPCLRETAGCARQSFNLEKNGELMEPLLTIQDVAKLLRVPVSWVYDRLRKNAPSPLPGFKLGKYWRFRQTEIVAWLNARHV